ncbi:HNH endonuclease [Fimbriiglobus ruber]|uniref:HNH endonuclease n=1 Tax=Fimbriiglobus ruber TaxID=1908690 RepID=UPI000B4BD944|nr:HNH endonuclease signature motif containing protein [Fimbriiglobus ruber]
MEAALRAFVRHRADYRCEYCRLHEGDADYLAFHVDHVIAKQHGGTDDPDALCYACSECNWAKGPNLARHLDGNFYPLFNPRRQNWKRHFRWEITTLVGKTKTGIVTIYVLNINAPSRVSLRENLLFEGRFPPDE